MNTKLSAEERTKLLLDEMTIEQKIQQIVISRFNENDTGETVVINRGGTSKYQNGVFAPQGTLPGCEWQDTRSADSWDRGTRHPHNPHDQRWYGCEGRIVWQ